MWDSHSWAGCDMPAGTDMHATVHVPVLSLRLSSPWSLAPGTAHIPSSGCGWVHAAVMLPLTSHLFARSAWRVRRRKPAHHGRPPSTAAHHQAAAVLRDKAVSHCLGCLLTSSAIAKGWAHHPCRVATPVGTRPVRARARRDMHVSPPHVHAQSMHSGIIPCVYHKLTLPRFPPATHRLIHYQRHAVLPLLWLHWPLCARQIRLLYG